MYFQEGICNVFLASLVVYLVWNQSTTRLLIGVFFYSTFHFLYSISSIDSYTDLVNMHAGSGDIVVKVTGSIFMLIIFLQLIMRLYRHVLIDRSVSIQFGAVMFLVLIGFTAQFQEQNCKFKILLALKLC